MTTGGAKRRKVGSLPTATASAHYRACKRCKKRFGAKACSKRLCGTCCALRGGTASHECLAHASQLRRASSDKNQGAFLLLASVKRIKRQQQHRSRSKTANRTTCEKGARLSGIDPSTLEALVLMQADEITRLRQELKQTQAENERLKRKRKNAKRGLCIICEDQQTNVLLVPCGHCYCRDCVDSVQSCPVCRASIRKRYSYHPPAYVCDEAILAGFGLPTSEPKRALPSSVVEWEESEEPEGDYSDLDDSAEEYGNEDEEEYEESEEEEAVEWTFSSPEPVYADDDILRRRSASNPHRVLFV